MKQQDRLRKQLIRYEDLIIKASIDSLTFREHAECIKLRKWIMKGIGIKI